MAVPESKLRVRILRGNGRKSEARTFQVQKTLEFQVPPVRVANQDVIDSILDGRNRLPHDTTSEKVVHLTGRSFQSRLSSTCIPAKGTLTPYFFVDEAFCACPAAGIRAEEHK